MRHTISTEILCWSAGVRDRYWTGVEIKYYGRIKRVAIWTHAVDLDRMQFAKMPELAKGTPA